MNKSLIDELIEAKHEHDNVLASVFNDGKVRKDEKYMAKYLKDDFLDDKFYLITETMKSATKMYALGYEFDTISMDLLLGLIYDINDLNEDNSIKENAQPVDGMVRFYTSTVNSYLDGEKTNKYEYDMGRQGFIKFNKLMSNISKSGLEYTGPKTFEELKERILNGEIFDINLTASLNEKDNTKPNEIIEEVKNDIIEESEPVLEQSKSRIKRFLNLK